MDDIRALEGHLRDLAERSYDRGMYTFSGFLGEAQKNVLAGMMKELSYAGVDTYGGHKYADRIVARFGNEALLGYDQEYPIACLRISPGSERFSETLAHRDFLGALIGLGIERELLGDIIVKENVAYVFCLEHAAGFIEENLIQVRRTGICVNRIDQLPEDAAVQFREMTVIVSSVRLDAIVSKLFHLSRNAGQQLFVSGRIFVNGMECRNESFCPKDGDIISVRGSGKFIYSGQDGITGKGRCRLTVRLFI